MEKGNQERVGSPLGEGMGVPFGEVSTVGGQRVEEGSAVEGPNMCIISKSDNQKLGTAPICYWMLCLLWCQPLKQA